MCESVGVEIANNFFWTLWDLCVFDKTVNYKIFEQYDSLGLELIEAYVEKYEIK